MFTLLSNTVSYLRVNYKNKLLWYTVFEMVIDYVDVYRLRRREKEIFSRHAIEFSDYDDQGPATIPKYPSSREILGQQPYAHEF